MRREKNPGRENLAGQFFYSKRSFILICIFLLTDKHKTIFGSHILYSGFAVGYFFIWGRKHFRAVNFNSFFLFLSLFFLFIFFLELSLIWGTINRVFVSCCSPIGELRNYSSKSPFTSKIICPYSSSLR